MANASILSGNETVYIQKELVYADVLVVYLGLVGLLSSAVRERIDPGVAIFLFEVIHGYRFDLLKSSSAVLNEIVSYSNRVFLIGDEWVPPVVYAMSPLDFWSAF